MNKANGRLRSWRSWTQARKTLSLRGVKVYVQYRPIRLIHEFSIIGTTTRQLICLDRVSGETKAFTPRCKLRKRLGGIRNYDAHRICQNHGHHVFFQIFFYRFDILISWTLHRMLCRPYRHEIICTGNTALFNSQVYVCEQCSGCLVLKNS